MYCLERNGTGRVRFNAAGRMVVGTECYRVVKMPRGESRIRACHGTGPIYQLAVYSPHLAFLSSEAFPALALTKVVAV